MSIPRQTTIPKSGFKRAAQLALVGPLAVLAFACNKGALEPRDAAMGGSSGSDAAAGTPGAGGTGAGGVGNGGSGAYHPCPANGDACKIMPFGDSITEGAPNNNGGYRIELFQLAHQAGKNITFVGSNSNGPAQVDGVSFPRQ